MLHRLSIDTAFVMNAFIQQKGIHDKRWNVGVIEKRATMDCSAERTNSDCHCPSRGQLNHPLIELLDHDMVARLRRPWVVEQAVARKEVDDASNGGNEGKGRCQHF